MKGTETMRKDSAVGILRRRRSFASSSARLFSNVSVSSLRSGRSRGFRLFLRNDRNYSTITFFVCCRHNCRRLFRLRRSVRAKAKLSACSYVFICAAARLGSCSYLERTAIKADAEHQEQSPEEQPRNINSTLKRALLG